MKSGDTCRRKTQVQRSLFKLRWLFVFLGENDGCYFGDELRNRRSPTYSGPIGRGSIAPTEAPLLQVWIDLRTCEMNRVGATCSDFGLFFERCI